nr:AGE family epimerase/isomerase [uncultured Cellulosilyticum sp.]
MINSPQMVQEIKGHLLYKINPFWKNLKDPEYGGFYGYMNEELVLNKEAVKGVILNSRIMWYFANLYLTMKNTEDLEYGKWAYEFFKNHCLDKEYGGVYWMLDYKGNVVEDMKHTYNQAFAIYALSTYYDASKDKEALDFAMSIFEKIETVARDEYGYLEAFNRDWSPIEENKLSDNKHLCAKGIYAEKTMNALLHILEAYTELYRVSRNEEVGNKLRDLLIVFDKQVYNREKRLLEVFFDKEMHTICDMHSYGHDIEAAWLLDRAAEVLGDEEIIKATKAYTVDIDYKIKEEAFVDGALNNERFEDFIDTTRIWWVQAETVVGFTNAYEKTGDKSFLALAEEEWEFIKKYMIDKRDDSEWCWQVDKEGNPVLPGPIVEPWKCPYHNGRMCMEIIRRNKNV